MKRLFDGKYELVVLFLIIAMVLLIVAGWLSIVKTSAQDTAPGWEYAILFYSSDDIVVYTDDPAATSELNAQFIEGGESVGLLTGMNIVGADGWELVDIVPGASSVYVFKREK